ncbi:MAG: DUF1800 family protein [Planctomycetota bacterium]
MSPTRLTLASLLLLAATTAGHAHADEKATKPAPTPTFFTGATVLHGPQSAVLPFKVPTADPDRDRSLHAGTTGPLQIVSPPEVLAGHTIGFVRVRPKPGLSQPTNATLTIGSATLQLRLQPTPLDQPDPLTLPTITTPTEGAAIWGTLTTAVEWPIDPDQPHLANAQPALRLDDNQTLKPVAITQFQNAPYKQAVFEIDAEQLPPGTVRLTPLLQHNDPKRPDTQGRAIALRVVRPEPGHLLTREAEAPNTQDDPIPELYRQQPPRINEDEHASGGKFVNNSGSQPVHTHPLNIESPGWYQLVLRARGSASTALLPNVGFRLNNERRPFTQGRIAHTDWHRVAIGKPILLKPEHRTLVPYFENDTSRGRNNDRNLHVDRIELLRLLDPPNAPHDFGQHNPASTAKLNIAFDTLWHGKHTTGDLALGTRLHLHNAKSQPAPTVELLLNGSIIATQTDFRPRFHLPHALLNPGTNTLQLTVRHPRLGFAQSATHTITHLAHPESQPSSDTPQPHARFPLTDPRWEHGKLIRERAAGHQPVLALTSNGQAVLNLPDELQGRFDLVLDARGDHFKGPPTAEFALEQGPETEALDPFAVDKKYANRTVGQITLEPGPKRLSLAFTNDLYDAKSKGDRNLYIRAVELRAVRPKDATPPTTNILYPKPNALLATADAVVIETREDRRLKHAEILLNGKPTGLRFETPHAQGRHLLPLPLRGIPDGSHTLSVKLTDAAGNTTTSPGVRVQTRQSPADTPTTYQQAVHLLNRFAFGPDPQQLAELLTLGTDAYLQQQLVQSSDRADHLATNNDAHTRFPNFGAHYHVVGRGLTTALLSREPVRHRFTLFISNHFNTWTRKTGGDLKAEEFDHFARLGAAPFTDLLFASAKSPAMIIYLDQQNSRNKRINENYARELMELHTVGVHGGYAQQDVTNLAHLLTGWTTAREGQYGRTIHRYDPLQGQKPGQRMFGLRLDEATPPHRHDRTRQAFLMLARHPQTARYLATKLAEHYTQNPADPQLIDDLAHTFHTTGGDTAQMLLTLASHPAFASAIHTPRLAQPQPYAIGLARTAQTNDPHAVDRYLNAAGNRLFDRETPDGYPDTDTDYADSNAFIQRWKFAHNLRYHLTNTIHAHLRDAPQNAKPGSPEYEAWANRIIDLLALRITGQPLSPRSHQAARKLLAQTKHHGYNQIKPLAVFIAQTPDASLR